MNALLDQFLAQNLAMLNPHNYGFRQDGAYKGRGFLGEQITDRGTPATEYTIGVKIDGKEMDIPTMIPTLSEDELKYVLSEGDLTNKDIPIATRIIEKAVNFAKDRLANGLGVFAGFSEEGNPDYQTRNR